MRVSAESALRISAVYRCVNLIAGTIASLPLHLYEKRDDGGRTRAERHPLYKLLRDQPNVRQTSVEWLEMGIAYVLLRGNFYNQILFDRRGAVRELVPLHPDRVVCRMDYSTGRRTYVFHPIRGQQIPLTQDEVLHVMGLSLNDGVTGVSVLEYAAEAIGAATAQQGYTSRFWAQGAEPSLLLSAPGPMRPETRAANEAAWQQRLGGWQNAHKVVLLEGGIKPERLGMTAREAQFIDGRKFAVADVARFFGVPPHMIGDVDGSTSWGTGIAEQTLGFLKFTLMPWMEKLTAAIRRDLIIEDTTFYAEFLTDALERMDVEKRSEIHQRSVGGPIRTRNEARIIENLNPVEGGDELLAPVNMDPGGDPNGPRTPDSTPPPRRPAPQGDPDDDGAADAKAWRITRASADGLVRKEAATITKWAARYAADAPGWRKWVAGFYAEYAGDLEARLDMNQDAARAYCADHGAALLEHGVTIVETWAQGADALATLALGEGAAPVVSDTAAILAALSERAPVNITVQPSPPAQVTVPITVEQPAVHIDARVVEGAVQVHVPAPEAFTVEKAVEHNAEGRVVKVRETHSPRRD